MIKDHKRRQRHTKLIDPVHNFTRGGLVYSKVASLFGLLTGSESKLGAIHKLPRWARGDLPNVYAFLSGGDFLRKQGGDRRCLPIAYVCLLRGGGGLQISFVYGPFCVHSSAEVLSSSDELNTLRLCQLMSGRKRGRTQTIFEALPLHIIDKRRQLANTSGLLPVCVKSLPPLRNP